MQSKSKAVVALSVLVLAAVALPVAAGDAAWKLRFGLLFGSPTADFASAGQTTELDDATGFQVSGEFPVTDRIGIEPGLGYAKHDISIEEPGFPTLDLGETTWTALTVNGNFHVLDRGRVDLYVGPTVGYVFWDSIETDLLPSDIETDDEFTIGANVGIDVSLGDSSWAFAAALRYLSADLPVKDGQDIGVDPIQVNVGLSRRF